MLEFIVVALALATAICVRWNDSVRTYNQIVFPSVQKNEWPSLVGMWLCSIAVVFLVLLAFINTATTWRFK